MPDRKTVLEYDAFFCEQHTASHKILGGASPVMISAPHSVTQTRDGVEKCAEPQTGTLAILLNQTLGCHAIYKTRNCCDDANYDDKSTYRNDLINYIRNNNVKMLLDLHQLAPSREIDIAIGTGRMKNAGNIPLINTIAAAFLYKGICNVQIDGKYSASGTNTVCSTVSAAAAIPCIQIEINSALIYSLDATDKFNDVFEALCDAVSGACRILKD